MPSLNDLDALCPTETSDVPLLRCGICGVECPETHLTKLGRKNLCVSCHMAERKELEQKNVIRSETVNTTAPVRARRVGDNEVIISAPLQTAFVQVVAAIEKLGKVKRREQASHFVEGRIKFGLQSVKVRVSMVERDFGKTTAVIQGSSDDVWGAGAKNATKRLVEVLENLDNPGFKPGAAKIIHCDPPYVYRKTAHGGYASSSSRSRRCDNATGDGGLSLVIDLLREWQPKLTTGGVLLLWQASGPLHRDILQAVEQFEWELTGPITWDKGRPQPGDLGAPYSRQTEQLWVLSRAGDNLINHDGSSRSDILRFCPVSSPSLAGQQEHCFEKPRGLCEFLIRKHSHRRELVLDLCGCTASTTLAAIDSGRHWVYVESNADNFRIGADRIGRELEKRTSRAS